MPRLVLIMFLLVTGCSRPADTPPTPPPIEQPAEVPPTPIEPDPVEPPAPTLTAAILMEVQDRMHRMLDRSLGVALTMGSYTHRTDDTKVGNVKWVGAEAQFQIRGMTIGAITPKDLPCDVTNDGAWRRAWTGRGGAATTFEVVPQWWTFSMPGADAYVRVGATHLTAMVWDASRKCWTGASILEPPRRPVALNSLGEPTGTMGPGSSEAALFGTVGKLTVSSKKITFFDGSKRISFEPSDRRKCVWLEWGKNEVGYWVWARFSSAPQADRCPEDVDVATEEFLEIRDANGELVRALRDTAPGEQAPLSRRTHFVRQALGDTVAIWEATEEHGVAEPPAAWNARCKAVHRDDLSEPVLPVASKRSFVGVWTVQRDGKDFASGVGRRAVVELDCVSAD